MKIKQVIFTIALGIIVLYAVKGIFGGFVFSKTLSFSIIFLALYSGAAWLATKVRIFFLLPNIILLDILFHAILLYVVFWLADTVIGGVTVTTLNKELLSSLHIVLPKQLAGEFGTISVVSLVTATVYQLLIWLNKEK